MNKSNIGLRNLTVPIVVVMLIMFSLSSVFVAAQSAYQTEVDDVSILESGIVTVDVPEADISYEITGAPGATGTVTTAIYNENPNPTAIVPTGLGLTIYVVVTFNMDLSDFLKAVITISYTDADLEDLTIPYAVYKYIPESNSFIELTTVVDTVAKTMTITVTSIEDPLFAIGGTATVPIPPPSATYWVFIALAIILAVILVSLAVIIIRGSARNLFS